jgi:hypothetical protein
MGTRDGRSSIARHAAWPAPAARPVDPAGKVPEPTRRRGAASPVPNPTTPLDPLSALTMSVVRTGNAPFLPRARPIRRLQRRYPTTNTPTPNSHPVCLTLPAQPSPPSRSPSSHEPVGTRTWIAMGRDGTERDRLGHDEGNGTGSNRDANLLLLGADLRIVSASVPKELPWQRFAGRIELPFLLIPAASGESVLCTLTAKWPSTAAIPPIPQHPLHCHGLPHISPRRQHHHHRHRR